MVLETIASGSSGNCYALYGEENDILLLDLGVSEKVIKKGIDWKISNVVGAVVSHSHSDHAKSTGTFEKMGIKVFKPYQILDDRQLDDRKMLAAQLGNFKIRAFQVPHNGTRNCGFVIQGYGHTVLYMTDYEYCPYNFRKTPIDTMLIECNYISDMVNADAANYEHKVLGHAELDTVRRFIMASRTDTLNNIILCHLGQGTSDKGRIISEIKKVAIGVNVDVAEPKSGWILMPPGECPF